MCGPLLFLGLMLPALELAVLIQVGARIGIFETILLIFLTAVVGLQFVRGQGLGALQRLQGPALPREAHMLDAPLLVAAAVFLLFPGFITDFIGALLLVPMLRRLFARWLIARFRSKNNPQRPDDDRVIVIQRRHGRGDC